MPTTIPEVERESLTDTIWCLESCGVDVGVLNALERLRVFRICDLMRWSEAELRAVPNFGEIQVAKIIYGLQEYAAQHRWTVTP